MRTSIGLMCCMAALCVGHAENWPQWRGPSLNGISNEKNLPVRWSMTESIAWKLAMPGKTGATPIIWGNNVFLNVADGKNIHLWCVDKAKGVPVWKRLIDTANYDIKKQNMSSPSPVTDGKSVFVLTGTGILKGFDLAGNELWMRDIQKDYGKFGLSFGYGSSPLLYENGLYVQVLNKACYSTIGPGVPCVPVQAGLKTADPSYILKIDKKTGRTLWRVQRPTDSINECPDSYRTPMLLRYAERVEIVVAGGDCVTGHDAATGEEIWRGKGLNPDNKPDYRTVASVVVFDGILYVPSRVRPLIAFRAGGRGDITQSHRLWEFNDGPDVPTPVTDGKYLYSVNDRGIVWCLDAKTGREIWGSRRIRPASYSSSPVLADNKIYITNEEGLTTVLKAGPDFEVLAENDLDGYTLSSPAISDGQIFIRTAKFLYCIGNR